MSDQLKPRTVIACPEPHIERWYLADPESFRTVVGFRPNPGRKKCDRGRYKQMLAQAVVKGGFPPTLGGVEFAPDIVDAMDLYRAGRAEHSLKDFQTRLTQLLRLR